MESPLIEVGLTLNSHRDLSGEISEEILNVLALDLIKCLDLILTGLEDLSCLSLVSLVDTPGLENGISEKDS